jgi:DNA-directed RNA polymerase specialized sigma24 family protein
VLLRYVAGLQNTEIAEALGISPGTVAATLSQARAQLASFLDREGTPG